MNNSKKVIFTSALLAGAAITVSASDILSENSGYADLGTGAELRTQILYSDQGNLPLNVFEMKCAAKEKEGDKKVKEGKVKEGKTKDAKCGEGKCGADDKKAGDAKAGKKEAKLKSNKKAKDSKAKEAKCGEGKCGVE
jgi:uncharacterized low-complexity protein